MRRTVSKPVEVNGIGLHGGQQVTMTIAPAPAGSGICFIRIDASLDVQKIPAQYDLVSDTQLCTKLTNEHDVSVGTVEHVMAALAGTGVTDAVIALDGPEVPIMDGSSAPFVAAIIGVGVVDLQKPLKAIRILKTVRYEEEGKVAELSPSDDFAIDFRIEFADPAIGTQSRTMTMVGDVFATELSDCRTFGHLAEVEYLRSLGLVQGGSLQNAIVVDKGRVLNVEGLRRDDEFVRHKMLDAVGDLYLAGAPIIGLYTGVKAGHGMTNKLLRLLFDTPDAWCWETQDTDRALGGIVSMPQSSTDRAPALAS